MASFTDEEKERIRPKLAAVADNMAAKRDAQIEADPDLQAERSGLPSGMNSPEDVDKFVQSGLISPETGNELKQRIQPVDPQVAANRAMQGISEQVEFNRSIMETRDKMLKNDQALQQAGISNKVQAKNQELVDSEQEAARMREIDPAGFFKGEDGEVSFGILAGAALSSAMGAFASAFTGGPNFAQQIIDRAIDRNIAAQKSRAAGAERAAGAARTAYEFWSDKLKDKVAADLATRRDMLDGFIEKNKSLLQQAQTVESRQRLQQAEQSLQQRRTEIDNNLKTKVAGLALQERAMDQEAERFNIQERRTEEKAAKTQSNIEAAGFAELPLDAKGGFTKEAREALKIKRTTEEIMAKVDETVSIIAKGGADMFKGDRTKFKSAMASLVTTMRKIQDTGANMSEQEFENLKNEAGFTESFRIGSDISFEDKENVEAVLQALKERVRTQAQIGIDAQPGARLLEPFSDSKVRR